MKNPELNGKITILYQRISRDDPTNEGESNSILNQRRMLEKYAEENELAPYESISDDGYSGTGWARPGWEQIVELIEAGKVSALVVKNLDRMGRDHLRVGLYMEQFKERGVRFIAISDGIDTARGDDFTPFRAILAEWYAKDCSRKVKAVFQNKGNSGKPLCTTPIYGFLKDPNDKNKRIIDPEAAEVVRRIFHMTIEGIGPFQIAHIFCNEKIERPSYYYVRTGQLPMSKRCDPERKYNWDGSAVVKLIQNPAYKGDMVNFRTTKPSYKNKRSVKNPKENWVVYEDYYPVIVERETWELAQKLRKTKRKTPSLGAPNPLTGMLSCAQCGAKMSNRRGVRKNADENGESRVPRVDSYGCSANRVAAARFINKCSLHFITSKAVREMLLETIKCVALYARGNEMEFAEKLRETSTVKQASVARGNKRQFAKTEKRITELDVPYRKVYEDNAIGKLSDERFEIMSRDYEVEQVTLREQSTQLQALLDEYEQDSRSATKFLALAKKHPEFDELTLQMLHEFVDKVYVHDGDYSSGERCQQLDIYLNFIGEFKAPQVEHIPTPEEVAAAEADLERRIKMRAKHKA